MKEILKGLAFYFINHILNKIPSRKIRIFFYNKLSNGNISKKCSIGLGVKILDIRNITIGEYTNINFDSILDGRGDGIEIGKNVDIAPQVNIWSLEHDPNSSSHESRSGKVIIEDNCWIANRVTILPSTHIESNCVIGAASIVKGNYKKNSISMCRKASEVKVRNTFNNSKLDSIRVFR